MALGNKKSENAGPGAGATPPPPPPFAEPTPSDGLISSLDDRLQQLQATVTALVERSAGTAAEPAANDSEVVAASRTLKMAEKTADAIVAEAHEEAAKLIASARDQHDAMLVAAHKAADAEFAAQRDAVVAETAAWEAKKRELVEQFVKIEAQLTECDARLADAHRLVRSALDQPTTAPPPEATTASTTEPAAAGARVEPPLFTTPPADDSAAPVEVSAEVVEGEPAPKETVFGNPPAPVFTGPAKEESGAQAFYPWSGNSTPASDEDGVDSTTTNAEPPAPPVQRRGLFGH